jgi:ABC-type Mn2+/Zn2+ transport system permease subunit
MKDMMLLYFPNLLAGLAAAITLSVWGCQLAARDRSMHTLCISQGAMLGSLIGVIVLGLDNLAGPYASSLLVAILVGMLTEWMTRSTTSSVSTYFVGFFLILLAANHVLGGLFPAVSSHLTQIFYGDLVTVSEREAWFTLVISCFMLLLLVLFRRPISNRSFERYVFPEEARWLEPPSVKRTLLWIELLGFLYLCYAIQIFGFLFAIGALFIPTVFLCLGKKPRPNLKLHLFLSAVVMGVSVLVGLPLTLAYDNLPTVPTILLVAMGIAWLL